VVGWGESNSSESNISKGEEQKFGMRPLVVVVHRSLLPPHFRYAVIGYFLGGPSGIRLDCAAM
jgi:hypothetical protein